MKHRLFPVVLSCALTLSLLAKADTVTSKVSFGNPNKSCSGGGICKATTTTTKVSEESITVTFTWDAGTTHLTMNLPAASLADTPPEVLANLNKGRFVMEEALPLSREMIAGLKGPEGLRINAGTYPAKKGADGSIVVDFGAFAG